MVKISLIGTLLIFHGCLFCHGSSTRTYTTPSPTTMVGDYATTTYITPSSTTTVSGGAESTNTAVATTDTVFGVVVTTTVGGGGISSTTDGGEVSTTVASEGDVTTTSVATGGVTTSAVSGNGVTSTGGVGGGVTTTGDAAGQETATTVANSAVVGSEVTNTAITGGDSTSIGGAVTSILPVGVTATTTTGIGGRATSTVGGGETSSPVNNSVVSLTSTPTGPPSSTPTGSPPCSVWADIRVGFGPIVIFSLKITVDCSGGKLKVLIDIVIAGLLNISIKAGFIPCGVEVKSATCNSPFEGKFMLSLHGGGPSGVTIEEVFRDGLQQGAFGDDIKADNTVYTLEFQGVDIKKTPKPGECDRVCCNGAGGEMFVGVTCTPADKCTGIDLSDRKDDGYCPGDPKAYCECSKGLQDLPSFALITALGLTSLMKSIFSW